MDDEEFKSNSYQRVYQYIRQFIAKQNLDSFSFNECVEETPQDCLEIILQ